MLDISVSTAVMSGHERCQRTFFMMVRRSTQ
jgi:hypothetical protein